MVLAFGPDAFRGSCCYIISLGRAARAQHSGTGFRNPLLLRTPAGGTFSEREAAC